MTNVIRDGQPVAITPTVNHSIKHALWLTFSAQLLSSAIFPRSLLTMKRLMLTDLPGDIMIRILSSLHPRDIVNIRRTCTSLSHISRQKTIWIDAVNQMCEQDTLFRPSFPLQELYLTDSSTLEDISTGPMKWEKLFSENNYPLSQPNRKDAVKSLTMSPPSVFKSEIRYLFLVPGGRFLLGHDGEVFAVFDLHSDSIDEAVARLSMNHAPESSDPVTFVHPTSNLEKLQVAFFSMEPINNWTGTFARYSAEIYEISFPVASEPVIPQVNLVNSFSFLEKYEPDDWQECVATLSHNRFAFLFGDLLRLWDFRTDEWVVWHTDCEDISEIIFLEEELLFIHDDSISFCNPFVCGSIPRDQALRTSQSVEPRCDYDYLCPRSERRLGLPAPVLTVSESMMQCFDSWFNGTRPPTYFERRMAIASEVPTEDITPESATNLRIETFYLADDDPLYDMDHSDPRLEPVLVSQYKVLDSVNNFAFCIPSNGAMYRPARDHIGLYCRGIIDDGTGTRVVRDVRLQDLPSELDMGFASVCPASGKVCYMLSSPEAINTIHILELF